MFVIAIALLQLANLQNQQKRMFMEEYSDMLLVFFSSIRRKWIDGLMLFIFSKTKSLNSISTEMILNKKCKQVLNREVCILDRNQLITRTIRYV